jgi:hypothetical protein
MPEETTAKPAKNEKAYSFRFKTGSPHQQQIDELIAQGKAKLQNPKTEQYGTGSVVRELLDLHAGRVTGTPPPDVEKKLSELEALKSYVEIIEAENQKLKTNNQQPSGTGLNFSDEETTIYEAVKTKIETHYSRQFTDEEIMKLLVAHFHYDKSAAFPRSETYAAEMLKFFNTIK